MMRDPNRRSPIGSLVGDLFGFEPLRMQQPESLGLDIRRTDQGYTLEIPVPGFRPEQIEVTVEDRELTVQGNGERRRFARAIVLPDEVDPERIEAHVEHGMLTLQLPMHAKMRPRRIDVRLGGSAQGGVSAAGGGEGAGTQTYSAPSGQDSTS